MDGKVQVSFITVAGPLWQAAQTNPAAQREKQTARGGF